MRNFTPEEKELIVNTSITEDVFDLTDFCELDAIDCVARSFSPIYDLHCIAESCDHIRELYKITKDERLFTELVRLLPSSYKVVNLCAEQGKKDFCKYKHNVSGKEVSVSSIGTWNKSFENCIHGEEEEVKAPYPSYKHLFGESIEQTALRHSNDLINSLRVDIDYAKTIIQDMLNNSDEYTRQRAMDFLKEDK